MRQMAALVYAWSRYEPDRRRNVNGHFVQAAPGQPGALIDPVAFHEGDEAEVRELGGVAAVVLTQPDRVAEAVRCRDAFGCPLSVPQETTPELLDAASPAGVETFAAGAQLPAGLSAAVVAAGGAAARSDASGVVAFYHEPSGTGIVGGAVVGAPAGELSVAPSNIPSQATSGDSPAATPSAGVPAGSSGAERARIARSLRALLAFPLRRLLVAEGEAVLREPERALQDLIYRHDPAACLLRPDELVWSPPREKGSRFSRRSGECSRLLGLRTLDFEVTAVPPGKQNTLLHRHDGAEEAFIILAGEGEVQTESGVFPVRAGDVLGFPPRYQVAHAIRNTGDAELRFLAFGAWTEPSEAVHLAEYPESNKQSQWVPGKSRRFYLPEHVQVDYWAGERVDRT